MNVIFNAADDQRGAIEVFANAGHVGVRAFAERFVAMEWLAIFRGEHDVEVDLDKGLPHGRPL